jgi:hypothetical protein
MHELLLLSIKGSKYSGTALEGDLALPGPTARNHGNPQFSHRRSSPILKKMAFSLWWRFFAEQALSFTGVSDDSFLSIYSN